VYLIGKLGLCAGRVLSTYMQLAQTKSQCNPMVLIVFKEAQSVALAFIGRGKVRIFLYCPMCTLQSTRPFHAKDKEKKPTHPLLLTDRNARVAPSLQTMEDAGLGTLLS
jgi:hypothetical protein